MAKRLCLILGLCILAGGLAFTFLHTTRSSGMPANDGIGGLWKSIDEKTGKPQCVVAIYNYQGVYYGRIIGTYDDAGRMKETIYNPQGRAPGVVGSPFYCGLDFIWGLKNEGDAKYAGRIMDPEKGSVYHAELWVQNGNLIVRGELLFFGRNQTWLPALKTDFPKGFKFPDTSKFTPTIPHEK